MRAMKKVVPAFLALLLAQLSVWPKSAQAIADGHDKLAAVASSRIPDIVRNEIRTGQIPGAVIVIGTRGKVIYRKAFGYRALEGKPVAMTEDAIFDLASLTKVVATSTAVMQLVERGKLDLDSPVAAYWPEFGVNGKARITVREVFTHYSGLRPDLSLESQWSGYRDAMRLVVGERPIYPPDVHFFYSDVNFEVLGEIVRRVSGEPLEVYCSRHIFKPLRMKDTGFRPPLAKRARIAPTEYVNGKLRWGEVHDPTADRMGGVAGHAGLFSTVDDLSIFARMMLNGGTFNGVRILRKVTIEEMTTPQSPRDGTRFRGLGWDVDAPFASNRDQLPPFGSYGHTGFTGTSIWIDPVTETYVIILTSRLYPKGKGDVGPLRKELLALVSQTMGPLSPSDVVARRPSLKQLYETTASRDRASLGARVETGADVLIAEQFAPLRGLRIGLITNHSGVDSKGNRLADLLYRSNNVRLVAIFTPEHGLTGDRDEQIASGMDPKTNLPVFSLYGQVLRPTDAMLGGLDALVFDVQDSGARFYTYATTMAYAMEAAAKRGIDFYVLDRPNPIDAAIVQGPVMDPDLKSFVGYFSTPVRHGMTMGELAQMFNAENAIRARLHIIRMQGYRRSYWYDDTGLAWVAPSPNLRTLGEAALYPGVAMLEGANLSVGRGTDTPFELVGAPWIAGSGLAAYLNSRGIPGVRFLPADFTPAADRYRNQACHGVRIVLVDRRALDVAALGVEMASALHRLYPTEFQIDRILPLVGSRWVLSAIESDAAPESIERRWRPSLDAFCKLRAKYLLY